MPQINNQNQDITLLGHKLTWSVELFVTLILLVIIFGLSRIVIRWYHKRKGSKLRDNFVIGIKQLTYMLMGLVSFFAMLLVFNVPVKEFFTSISIVAAALAVVFKEYISNALNGMILMFGDRVRINDYIKVTGHKGKVIDLSLLHVILVDDDDDIVYIPNNNVLSNDLINYSKGDKKYISVEFEVEPNQLPLTEDYENLIMRKLIENGIKPDKSNYRLRVEEVKNGLAEVKFQVRTEEFEKDQAKAKRQLLKKAMLDSLIK